MQTNELDDARENWDRFEKKKTRVQKDIQLKLAAVRSAEDEKNACERSVLIS